MECELIVHKEEGYIEIITKGLADKDSSLLMATTITENMRKNRITKVLIDHCKIDSVTGQVLDVYNRPKMLKVIGAIMQIRIAEVIKPEHREHFRFFETVCLNQGFRVSIFQERDKALEWLLR
jgi:hypothetical protein